jgi:hypothetical protein
MPKVLFFTTYSNYAKTFCPIITKLQNNSYNQKEKLKVKVICTDGITENGIGAIYEYKKIKFTQLLDYPTKNLKTIFKVESPDVVILNNDVELLAHLTIQISKSLGFKTIIIEDGFPGPRMRKNSIKNTYKRTLNNLNTRFKEFQYFLNSLYLLNFVKLYCKRTIGHAPAGSKGSDYLAVQSSFSKMIYKNKIQSNSKIKITGQPRFEYDHPLLYKEKIKNVSKYEREDLLNKFVTDNNKMILIISQPLVKGGFINSEENKELFVKPIEELLKGTNYKIVIKLHPREHFNVDYKILKQKNSDRVMILKNYPLDILLSRSFIVIGTASTVLFEASFYNTLPLLFGHYIYSPLNFFVYSQVFKIKTINSIHEIGELISELENEEIYNKYLKENKKKSIAAIGEINGRASDNVINLILSII